MTDVAQMTCLNAALLQLGNEPVSDILDEQIEESGALFKLLRAMDLARDVVLGRHGWLCVLQYTVLTPEAAPPGNWKFPWQYLLPGDCIRPWEIGGIVFQGTEHECWGPRWQSATIDNDIGSRLLIRSRDKIDSLRIGYVRRPSSWMALAPHLLDAIGWELAGRTCYAINGDAAKAKDLKKEAEGKVLMAISVDGVQTGGEEPVSPSIPAMIRNLSR